MLFNVIAAAVADDGRSFFYASTLHRHTPTVVVPADRDWPYGSEPESGPRSPRVVPLVPYHRWARRGPTTMRVWLPTTPP